MEEALGSDFLSATHLTAIITGMTGFIIHISKTLFTSGIPVFISITGIHL